MIQDGSSKKSDTENQPLDICLCYRRVSAGFIKTECIRSKGCEKDADHKPA